MGFGGGGNAGDQAQANYLQQQAEIQKGLGQINNTFAGFTPAFYNQRAQDYTNYAMPQLQQQFQQNQQGLNFNLGQQGLLKSSAGQDLNAKLGQQYRLGQQGIANQGLQQSQQLQQQVANTQGQLIGQLTASANPSSVAGQSINAAANYSAPSAFAPVGNLFSQWGNIYAANSLAGAGQQGASGANPFGGFGTTRTTSGPNVPVSFGGG